MICLARKMTDRSARRANRTFSEGISVSALTLPKHGTAAFSCPHSGDRLASIHGYTLAHARHPHLICPRQDGPTSTRRLSNHPNIWVRLSPRKDRQITITGTKQVTAPRPARLILLAIFDSPHHSVLDIDSETLLRLRSNTMSLVVTHHHFPHFPPHTEIMHDVAISVAPIPRRIYRSPAQNLLSV